MATRTTTKKAELKTSTAKPATEKEAPAKKTVTKKVTEKAATVKKTAVRKTSSRKTVSLNTEVYVQWLGKEVYERDGRTFNYYDCAGDVIQLKKILEWLREVDATALQSSLRDLDAAFQNFFRRVKRGEKHGYPRFKGRKDHRQSYKSKCVGTNIKVLEKAYSFRSSAL